MTSPLGNAYATESGLYAFRIPSIFLALYASTNDWATCSGVFWAVWPETKAPRQSVKAACAVIILNFIQESPRSYSYLSILSQRAPFRRIHPRRTCEFSLEFCNCDSTCRADEVSLSFPAFSGSAETGQASRIHHAIR